MIIWQLAAATKAMVAKRILVEGMMLSYDVRFGRCFDVENVVCVLFGDVGRIELVMGVRERERERLIKIGF